MILKEICNVLEEYAPLHLQENYDNAGLLIGDPEIEISGALLTIDITEKVISEAISKNCQLIISHHPLNFKGLKRLSGKSEVERCVLAAIKNDIAIYAAHTNLDNVKGGVSYKMAELLGLQNLRILQPIQKSLLKLITFVPQLHSYTLRSALFDAGAGNIGNYDSCSYNVEGFGTFRANINANPFVGEIGTLHTEQETRIEVILPEYKMNDVVKALYKNHPYEEPAYDIIRLENSSVDTGVGVIGVLAEPLDVNEFLEKLKLTFKCGSIRHTAFIGNKIKNVALCGGSGSFLISDAIREGADIFISADFKYHDFFLADNRILIADIGHYESEQFTKDIFYEIITKKMPTFAIQISEINTNPIKYL